ncbi:aurora kinase A- and ninein-interacting protein [Erinaceus europaeus]|uniref:Aurora kinase A- and ninein-interacting protein n=1 Tax=Erinaceus europaeus TaxID=9365 RepID=A0ABM3YKG5_ERIEU|nr:aurora kinase A- and ninein-interacting protein [Erinaceus europaeus]
MRRRAPEEKEACGVWLDAAALKRRKMQTQLITSGTKLITLFPGERKAKPSFTQRTPPTGIRQTSIASFFTLQPGKTNGDKKSGLSPIGSQTNKESKKDVTQPGHLVQNTASPLATSTPVDIQEAGFSPQSLKTFDDLRMGSPFLTVLYPDTLVCAGESKACSFIQSLEDSCLLDKKRDDDSWKRERLNRCKIQNCQDVEKYTKLPKDKDPQPSDRTKLEYVYAKENKQTSVLLQTCKGSWSGENTELVKQNPYPVSVFSWDSEKNGRDSWSQLFTEDSQGQQVIAHNSARSPFQDVTNNQNQGLGQYPNSPWAKCQYRSTQLSLQSDVLFTQDSEGNQVIRH